MRLVLDTNVVLDLVVFGDPGVSALRAAIESGRVAVVTSGECLAELRRVLAYPRFGLDPGARDIAFAQFETLARALPDPPPDPRLPRCSDPDDQKFLDLAWAGEAAALVTKDRALLDLARRIDRLGRFLVCLPTDLRLPPA